MSLRDQPGRHGAQVPCLVVSNRNQTLRAPSSIQFSRRLAPTVAFLVARRVRLAHACHQELVVYSHGLGRSSGAKLPLIAQQ
jgi:hypothetical protein